MRKRIFSWLGTLVLLLAALALFPSAASVALLLTGALLLPLPRWQELLKERLLLYGQLKAVTAVALFVCGAALALAGPLQSLQLPAASVLSAATADAAAADTDAAPAQSEAVTPDASASSEPSAEPSPEASTEPSDDSSSEQADDPSSQPSGEVSPEVSADSSVEPSAAPSAESSPDSAQSADAAESVVREYILNTSSKKFHLPTCSSVARMNESNKQTFTGTREELIAQGYTPCGNCNP